MRSEVNEMENDRSIVKAGPPRRGERKKERSDHEKRELLNRLSRIEGQIRGIRRMVEEDC